MIVQHWTACSASRRALSTESRYKLESDTESDLPDTVPLSCNNNKNNSLPYRHATSQKTKDPRPNRHMSKIIDKFFRNSQIFSHHLHCTEEIQF